MNEADTAAPLNEWARARLRSGRTAECQAALSLMVSVGTVMAPGGPVLLMRAFDMDRDWQAGRGARPWYSGDHITMETTSGDPVVHEIAGASREL